MNEAEARGEGIYQIAMESGEKGPIGHYPAP